MEKLQKIIDEIKSMTVVELAELVEKIQEEFGVSAASLAAPAAAAAAPEVAAKTSFKVEITAYADTDKMKVIKALRAVKSTLGLIEAKTAVESISQTSPYLLSAEANKEESESMKKTLEEAGATVRIS